MDPRFGDVSPEWGDGRREPWSEPVQQGAQAEDEQGRHRDVQACLHHRPEPDGAVPVATPIQPPAPEASFRGTAFGGDTGFDKATFAEFDKATFTGDTSFRGATFAGDARFAGASFTGTARFEWAAFTGSGDGFSFEGAQVLSPGLQHVWPTDWCLGPDGSGGYTVIRANKDGRS